MPPPSPHPGRAGLWLFWPMLLHVAVPQGHGPGGCRIGAGLLQRSCAAAWLRPSTSHRFRCSQPGGAILHSACQLPVAGLPEASARWPGSAPLGLRASPWQGRCRQLGSSTLRRPAVAGKLFTAEAPGQHDATVIWLHGLGDTGEGWADVGPQLQQLLPTVRFLFPTAPSQPVTVNMGMRMPSWFDINSLDPALFTLDPPGLAESSEYVRALVLAELDAGVLPERIVLAGFSQGGAVVLATALGPPQTAVGGVLVLSSFLGSALPSATSGTKLPPVYFFHGEADRVVPLSWGQRSFQTLQAAGLDVSFRSYPGMQHSACMDEIQDIANILGKILG